MEKYVSFNFIIETSILNEYRDDDFKKVNVNRYVSDVNFIITKIKKYFMFIGNKWTIQTTA